MRCPHCGTGTRPRFEITSTWPYDPDNDRGTGYRLAYGHCTECDKLIVIMQRGNITFDGKHGVHILDEVGDERIIYPLSYSHNIEPEVPEKYKSDFKEACAVLPLSPKASAALSRRLLQNILREHFGIKRPDLAKEIEEFINRKDVPTYLAEAVDAVRNVGNFAAHPLKNTNTGEIVDVEPGEAEWLLEVLGSLFDFAFVQPARLDAKKKQLNDKLQALGKPPMKEPPKS